MNEAVRIHLDMESPDDYARFLQIKALPKYAFCGRTAIVPPEYAAFLGLSVALPDLPDYQPPEWMFDYQGDITALALRKRKFAMFEDCGLGKTLQFAEWARYVIGALPADRCLLWVCPLMVVEQTLDELAKFYSAYPIEQVRAHQLKDWLHHGAGRIGLTNYEALTDELEPGRLGAMILDESSMLKSHYGKWGTTCIRLGRGLDWKLCGTGTPAPNDRIEYANHAVFLDQFPTINAFLARFFVNRGETGNRWELKPHALRPFYRALSDWCIFLTNPATYGWHDNCANIPPINVHIHEVPLTGEQRTAVMDTTGNLVVTGAGGIGQRSRLGQIAKGKGCTTNKPGYIRGLVDSWPDESTIIWCLYNDEQESMARTFPDAANITGDTPYDERITLLRQFKAGERKQLITKPKILGFGQNLQIATRHVFSGLQDSYEQYYQAVKRSNRYGSTRPLNVHIPVTEIERPMIETVLTKAARVQRDTEEQEAMFKESMMRGAIHAA